MDFTPTGEWHTSNALLYAAHTISRTHFILTPSFTLDSPLLLFSLFPSLHPLPPLFLFFLPFLLSPYLTLFPSSSYFHSLILLLPPPSFCPPLFPPLFLSSLPAYLPSLPPSLSFIPLVTILGEYRRPWMSTARRPKLDHLRHCMALNKQGILKTPFPSLENGLQ